MMPPRRHPLILRITRMLGLAIMLGLFSAESAFPHAALISTDPLAEAVLTRMPADVRLTFGEPVGPLALTWLLPDGRTLPAQITSQDNTLIAASPSDAGEGSYLLNWRVASTDGHPVAGTLIFAVGKPSRAGPTVATGDPQVVAAAAGRAVLSLTLIMAVGMALSQCLIAPLGRRMARIGGMAAMLVLPLALLALGLHGLDMLGLPATGLLQTAPWAAAFGAPMAVTAALAVLAAALCLPAIAQRSRPAAFAAWGAAALSFAASGHAATADPRLLAAPLVVLHALALIFWLGCLPPLLTGIGQPDTTLRLSRFSRLALPGVLVLIGSGASLTVLQAGSRAALTGTTWGLLLLAKLSVVAVMLALALANRLVLTPRWVAGRTGSDRWLRRSIGTEIALGILVLALASGFRLTPPPRMIPAAVPALLHIHTDKAMLTAELSPGMPGQTMITAYISTGDLEPLQPKEVTLTFLDPALGIGPMTVTALAAPNGEWTAGPVTLPSPGPWEVRAALLISDFDEISIVGKVTLGTGN